jgi:hypothetical protein
MINRLFGYALDITIIIIAGLVAYVVIIVIPETICGFLGLP